MMRSLRNLLFRLAGLYHVRGIPGNMGGDFKEYGFRENMPDRIAALKAGLDAESIALLDVLIERIQRFPSLHAQGDPRWWPRAFFVEASLLMTPEEKDVRADLRAEFLRQSRGLVFPRKRKPDPYVFHYHHGLRELPGTIRDYIRDTEFIDGGAYIGDSALMLLRYEPRKVFSFEFSPKNANGFREVMQLNGVGGDRIELVPLGLAETRRTIRIDDSGGSDMNAFTPGNDEAALVSLDEYRDENASEHAGGDGRVGFVKLDVEGGEIDAVRGMKKTLRKDRPVLSLSMYHNPEQFFELKPLVESFDLNYRFRIRRFSAVMSMPLVDTCLLAYPAELDSPESREAS